MLATVDVAEKKCRVCMEYYPLSEYAKRKDSRDGHVTICRACDAARKKESYDREKATRVHAPWEWVGNRGYSYLGMAVIRQAVVEWRRGGNRSELIRFFKSPAFDLMCDSAGLNPDIVRVQIDARLEVK